MTKNGNISLLMSGSCHLDRASNVEIGVEFQIFVIVIFFNCDWVLKFLAHLRYYKGALTQKRSFLVIWTTFRSDFYVSWKNQNKIRHLTLCPNDMNQTLTNKKKSMINAELYSSQLIKLTDNCHISLYILLRLKCQYT